MMKTVVHLPRELMDAVRMWARQEIRKLKGMVAALLGRGQEPQAQQGIRRRVRLPLVHCAYQARPGEEMTPDRVAGVLLEGEARGAAGR
jgi:hypothetical protein